MSRVKPSKERLDSLKSQLEKVQGQLLASRELKEIVLMPGWKRVTREFLSDINEIEDKLDKFLNYPERVVSALLQARLDYRRITAHLKTFADGTEQLEEKANQLKKEIDDYERKLNSFD